MRAYTTLEHGHWLNPAAPWEVRSKAGLTVSRHATRGAAVRAARGCMEVVDARQTDTPNTGGGHRVGNRKEIQS